VFVITDKKDMNAKQSDHPAPMEACWGNKLRLDLFALKRSTGHSDYFAGGKKKT